MSLGKQRVGLIFGGRSAEHEVSVDSARTIASALEQAGHEPIPLGLAADGSWVSEAQSRGALAGERNRLSGEGGTARSTLPRLLDSAADVLFPIVHGTWGEDGCLQGLAEMMDIPYVGCDVASSAVCMDKHRCKVELDASGFPVVAGFTFLARSYFGHRRDQIMSLFDLSRLSWPVFVKPSLGGSSVGVAKVHDEEGFLAALEKAFTLSPTVEVERAVVGRELECAILGQHNVRASVVGEIVASRDFYDYTDKYLEDGAELRAPAPIPEEVSENLREMALGAFTAVGGSGMARVDFFWEESVDELWINEINTLPGFTAISMYPRLWQLSGLTLPELVDELLVAAFQRAEDRQRLDAGIARFLTELEAAD
ncbi:MAG: D-alanine--D-alanine ligase family protein [Acidobacteriota bacterium]